MFNRAVMSYCNRSIDLPWWPYLSYSFHVQIQGDLSWTVSSCDQFQFTYGSCAWKAWIDYIVVSLMRNGKWKYSGRCWEYISHNLFLMGCYSWFHEGYCEAHLGPPPIKVYDIPHITLWGGSPGAITNACASVSVHACSLSIVFLRTFFFMMSS